VHARAISLQLNERSGEPRPRRDVDSRRRPNLSAELRPRAIIDARTSNRDRADERLASLSPSRRRRRRGAGEGGGGGERGGKASRSFRRAAIILKPTTRCDGADIAIR